MNTLNNYYISTMKSEAIVRCVNMDNGKVKYFPSSICHNPWWQKNTRFMPQPVEEIQLVENKSSIINENLSESVSELTETIEDELDIDADTVEKPKRKYTKKKKTDEPNSTE